MKKWIYENLYTRSVPRTLGILYFTLLLTILLKCLLIPDCIIIYVFRFGFLIFSVYSLSMIIFSFFNEY